MTGAGGGGRRGVGKGGGGRFGGGNGGTYNGTETDPLFGVVAMLLQLLRLPLVLPRWDRSRVPFEA